MISFSRNFTVTRKLAFLLILSILASCQEISGPKTSEVKQNQIALYLLGPGDRGNFFVVTSNDLSIRGKCFDAHINGVYGFGKFINNDFEPYNLYTYFTRRHSPKGARELIKAIVPGQTVDVDFKISKCKNGFYDKSKHLAEFIGPVTVNR